MRLRSSLVATCAIISLLGLSSAFSQEAPQFTGQVTSAEEGPMEGVVVSAQHEGSNITISVVSDAKGQFQFPPSKLTAGPTKVSIRAVGYDLDGPTTVDLAAADKRPVESRHQTKEDKRALEAALGRGMGAQHPRRLCAKQFLENCNGAAMRLQRIMGKSSHPASEWPAVIDRMMAGYYPGSTPENPQRLVGKASREGLIRGYDIAKVGEYLASINLSASNTWKYDLKTLPRVTGRGTKVVITEYDLPRPTAEPHDAIVDRDGMVWYPGRGRIDRRQTGPEDRQGRQLRAAGFAKDFPDRRP